MLQETAVQAKAHLAVGEPQSFGGGTLQTDDEMSEFEGIMCTFAIFSFYKQKQLVFKKLKPATDVKQQQTHLLLRGTIDIIVISSMYCHCYYYYAINVHA